MKDRDPAVGDIVELRIGDIAYGGEGVGRLGGLAVFVPFVAVGERVRAEIRERRSQHARARLLEVLEPSPDRVEPPCPLFARCGGCQYQHLPYSVQLEIKSRQLDQALRRIGGFQDPPVAPIVPSPRTLGYRNRILVRSGWNKPEGRMAIGYLEHEGRRVVDVGECLLAEEELNRKLAGIRLDPPERSGTKFDLRLMPEEWDLPRDSFFQVNGSILPRLVETAARALESSGASRLLDVYCGIGFFCLQLAGRVERFLGIELDRKAIRSARENALRMGHRHGEFLASPAEISLPRVLARFDPRRTCVILDPPRKGCDPKVIEALIRHPPRQILYVSCHPATLCRDLRRLCGKGRFALEGVVPLDMFPQTGHLESVSDLRSRQAEDS